MWFYSTLGTNPNGITYEQYRHLPGQMMHLLYNAFPFLKVINVKQGLIYVHPQIPPTSCRSQITRYYRGYYKLEYFRGYYEGTTTHAVAAECPHSSSRSGTTLYETLHAAGWEDSR